LEWEIKERRIKSPLIERRYVRYVKSIPLNCLLVGEALEVAFLRKKYGGNGLGCRL